MQKIGSGPGATLPMFRVDYMTSGLSLIVKTALITTPTAKIEDKRSVWIPAPILDHAAPTFVEEYYQKSGHPRIPWHPPSDPVRRAQHRSERAYPTTLNRSFKLPVNPASPGSP
jgi:hypothetical protein